MKRLFVTIFYLLSLYTFCSAQLPAFKVLALYENSGHHLAYSKAAIKWLNQQAKANNFKVDYIQNTETITDSLLNQYRVFIQLDYPPYSWTPRAAAAFTKYIDEGKGGWVGFHHATLLGDFDGFKMWQWFSDFMGGIKFKNYIATFASGQVNVENKQHPVMKGVPSSFTIAKEEWYTYNQSPRPNVQVLASVDEKSYQPKTNITMGDHPVVWTNPHVKARNIYIFMGHSPDLFNSEAYKQLFKNAILYTAGKP